MELLDNKPCKLHSYSIHTSRLIQILSIATQHCFGAFNLPALLDTILQGIPHVIWYTDDVLETGKTEEEHFS